MTPSLWIMKPRYVIHKAVCRSPVIHKPPCPAAEHRTSATTTERISGPSSLNRVPLGSSSRKQLMSRGRSGVSVGC
jgi:hypothetical protein